MTPEDERHARIMVEGGCSLEEVALVFGWTLDDTLLTVAPALKVNPGAATTARKLLKNIRRRVSAIPVIHRAPDQHKLVATVYSLPVVVGKRAA